MNSDYIEQLKAFINLEQDTQNREIVELWSKPLATRVGGGEAIADVEVVRISDQQAVLRCKENQSKFRPGDSVRLNRGDPKNFDSVQCEIFKEREDELVVIPAYKMNFDLLWIGNGWAIDRDKLDVRHIMINTMNEIAEDSECAAFFRAFFQGKIEPVFDKERKAAAYDIAKPMGLNPSQRKAFANAYASRNYHLIQGPPGTGKTWVLAHLAATLASEGERVLITGFTHRAINNALVKIAKTTGFENLCKVGQEKNADDLTWDDGRVQNYEYFSHVPPSAHEGGMIIGGTCFAVRTRRLNDVPFDTIIFDEAGQVTLPLSMAGMMAGKRHVFIGDHQQMRPVVVAKHKEEWVSRSVFETMTDHAPGTMLDTTYRMNKAINEFPSRQFYGGRLKPSKEAADRRLELKREPARFSSILDPEKPDVFVDVNHKNRGMRCPEEAEIAAGVAAEAVSCGVSPEEIAIVAPYRAQCRLIRKRLQEILPDGCENIIVDTVERIQGQDKDMVIVSLITSDLGHAASRAEFFFQPNRLNVAITRPRVKRIVIGNHVLFETRPRGRKLKEWVEIFRGLYEQSPLIHFETEK